MRKEYEVTITRQITVTLKLTDDQANNIENYVDNNVVLSKEIDQALNAWDMENQIELLEVANG